jgi:hypothetical protein
VLAAIAVGIGSQYLPRRLPLVLMARFSRLPVPALRRTSDELQKASHAMAEQLYKQTQADAAHAESGSSHASHDDVKDGEVVDA